MELPKLYKTVIGLDVHQAQVTACALIEIADSTAIERKQFNAFKLGRAALAQRALTHRTRPSQIVPFIVLFHPISGIPKC